MGPYCSTRFRAPLFRLRTARRDRPRGRLPPARRRQWSAGLQTCASSIYAHEERVEAAECLWSLLRLTQQSLRQEWSNGREYRPVAWRPLENPRLIWLRHESERRFGSRPRSKSRTLTPSRRKRFSPSTLFPATIRYVKLGIQPIRRRHRFLPPLEQARRRALGSVEPFRVSPGRAAPPPANTPAPAASPPPRTRPSARPRRGPGGGGRRNGSAPPTSSPG